MRSIKSKYTRPEMLLWDNMDHRIFRRQPDMKGNPDFGNKQRKIAIFVDGCFWHGCPRCYKPPSTRAEYWRNKLERNTKNDKNVTKSLVGDGYHVYRFWEHEVLSDPMACVRRIVGENQQ